MYNTGDIVRVRSDLVVDASYNYVRFVGEMDKLRGHQVTIRDRWVRRGIGAKYGYHLNEDADGWVWVEEMFEPAAVPLELDEDGLCEILEDLYV